jgi:hypothetical protein
MICRWTGMIDAIGMMVRREKLSPEHHFRMLYKKLSRVKK